MVGDLIVFNNIKTWTTFLSVHWNCNFRRLEFKFLLVSINLNIQRVSSFLIFSLKGFIWDDGLLSHFVLILLALIFHFLPTFGFPHFPKGSGRRICFLQEVFWDFIYFSWRSCSIFIIEQVKKDNKLITNKYLQYFTVWIRYYNEL